MRELWDLEFSAAGGPGLGFGGVSLGLREQAPLDVSRCGSWCGGAGVEPSAALMWHQGGIGMTPATIDLNGLDSDIRANVLRQLTASGLSEQVFVNQVYHALAGGQFSLLDLLGPNAGTLEAMQELAEGRGVSVENIEQLFADLHADD